MWLPPVLLLLLPAHATGIRFAQQLAVMTRAADDSSAGRVLRGESDSVSFSWECGASAACTTVLERIDEAICGSEPCWLLTNKVVGRVAGTDSSDRDPDISVISTGAI